MLHCAVYGDVENVARRRHVRTTADVETGMGIVVGLLENGIDLMAAQSGGRNPRRMTSAQTTLESIIQSNNALDNQRPRIISKHIAIT